MRVQDLILAVNRQYVTVTGPDAGQCTAIAHYWEKMLGLPIVYGDAKDTLHNATADYDRADYKGQVPPPGAIMVFDASWGNGAGHTGVVVSATNKSFDLLEQNNPTGAVTGVQTHRSYAGVIGWFIPKVLTGAKQVTIDDATYQDLVNWKAAATAPGKIIIDQTELDDALRWKDHAIKDLQPQLDAANAQVTKLTKDGVKEVTINGVTFVSK